MSFCLFQFPKKENQIITSTVYNGVRENQPIILIALCVMRRRYKKKLLHQKGREHVGGGGVECLFHVLRRVSGRRVQESWRRIKINVRRKLNRKILVFFLCIDIFFLL